MTIGRRRQLIKGAQLIGSADRLGRFRSVGFRNATIWHDRHVKMPGVMKN